MRDLLLGLYCFLTTHSDCPIAIFATLLVGHEFAGITEACVILLLGGAVGYHSPRTGAKKRSVMI